ncbi:MAG: hypothetical protein WCX65_14600 [bacterium]
MKRYFIVLTAAIFAITIFGMAAMSSPIAKKNLKRKSDPVIIAGQKIEPMTGVSPEKIRMYAAGSNGVLKPIPYQIDERDENGDLIFPFGPKKSKDSNPDFDANDELVFMAKDAGARVARKAWPKDALKGAGIEIEDPLDGSRAWAYAFAFDSPPARSDVVYASISKDSMKITTPNFSTQFCKEAPIAFCAIALTPAGGGDGQNYIDRLKVRVSVTPKLINVCIEKSENDFASELIAYINGPVRVIRRTNNKMMLFGRIPSPGSIVDNVYYYDQFIFPTVIDVPFDMATFLREMKFRVTTDHNRRAIGKRFVNSNNPKGVAIDGKMSPEEKNLNLDPYKWMIIHGTEPGKRGGWLNRIYYDEGIKAQPYLYYMDDAKALDPPETDPGQIGNIGYDIRYMETLTKGTWRLTSYMYNIPDYHPGAEKEFLNILDHPLKISIK